MGEVQYEVSTTSIMITSVSAREGLTTPYSRASGIKGFYFKINGEDWSELQQNGEYIFDGLLPKTDYTVNVKVVDNAGNEDIKTLAVRTEEEGVVDPNDIGVSNWL